MDNLEQLCSKVSGWFEFNYKQNLLCFGSDWSGCNNCNWNWRNTENSLDAETSGAFWGRLGENILNHKIQSFFSCDSDLTTSFVHMYTYVHPSMTITQFSFLINHFSHQSTFSSINILINLQGVPQKITPCFGGL